MATELYRDTFGTITYDDSNGVLELKWLEGTSDMSDDDVKQWLERFTEFGGQQLPPFLLIDTRQFMHGWNKNLDTWRSEIIIPKYNAAGVKKMAFLFPEGVEPAREPAVEDPATYPTGYFDSLEAIESWFTS